MAACSGALEHHGTTQVPPAEMVHVEDAGEPLPSRNEQYCTLNAKDLEAHKRCDVDADCVELTYRPTCCANTLAVGVRESSYDALSVCVEKSLPVCACDAMPSRAEDGRPLLEDVSTQVRCEAGRCVSRVSERKCGNALTCKPGELCVSYSDAQSDGAADAGPTDNAYTAYACVPNPCTATLDCDCAQSACDARTAGTRTCAISRNDQADVACVRYRD